MKRKFVSRISKTCRKGSDGETEDPPSRTPAAEGDTPSPNAGHALPPQARCPARIPSDLTYDQLVAMRFLAMEQVAAFPPAWLPVTEGPAERSPKEFGALVSRLSEDRFLVDALGLSGLDEEGKVLLPAVIERLGDPLRRLHGLAEGRLSEERLMEPEGERARQARLVLEGCSVLLEDVNGG
jgi:hypothetical protein